jgi:epoxyqueuosine reductase QueG
VALGRAAGLGAASRLGLLLHPEFGPWMSLRAVVLTPLELPESGPLTDFDPCGGCAAPCASACRGSAIADDRFDVARCAATRLREAGCRSRCDARRACVIGPEHGYAAAAEAHHMAALPGS